MLFIQHYCILCKIKLSQENIIILLLILLDLKDASRRQKDSNQKWW